SVKAAKPSKASPRETILIVPAVIRLPAVEIRRIVGTAGSDVDGSLRIRAERTRAQYSQRGVVIDVFDRHDTLRRHAFLHPALERAQDVVFRVMVERSRLRQRLAEGVWTGATSTMRHPGRHEQAEERSITGIRVCHLLEIV